MGMKLPPAVEAQCERTPGAVVTRCNGAALGPAPRVPRPPALVAPGVALEVTVALSTPNPLNARPSTRQRIAGPRRQREAVLAALWAVGPRVPDWLPPPWHVALVKLGGQAVDGDAVPGCLKHARDAVAMWLLPGHAPGVTDEDSRIRWQPSWHEPGGPMGVRVRIKSGREA
jgi:hypothetical protein